MKTLQAFWFAPEDYRPIVLGETHSVTGDIVQFANGPQASQASINLYDAIWYATHHMLYLVKMSGDIIRLNTRIVARNRKYIACCDCKDILDKIRKQIMLDHLHYFEPYCTTHEYETLKKLFNENEPSKELIRLVRPIIFALRINHSDTAGVLCSVLEILVSNRPPIKQFKDLIHSINLLDNNAIVYIQLFKDLLKKQWDI